jgi:hypothetical protein
MDRYDGILYQTRRYLCGCTTEHAFTDDGDTKAYREIPKPCRDCYYRYRVAIDLARPLDPPTYKPRQWAEVQ